MFQLSFCLPRLDEPVSGRGEVVRVVGKERSGLYGAGIRFLDMTDHTVDRIRAFVELQTR